MTHYSSHSPDNSLHDPEICRAITDLLKNTLSRTLEEIHQHTGHDLDQLEDQAIILHSHDAIEIADLNSSREHLTLSMSDDQVYRAAQLCERSRDEMKGENTGV